MEEEKRVEVQRAIVEFKHGDDRTQTLLFTAGTTLLMAWLKRAVMMCLVEQWRAWVFLALNLVLLAIVFTSTRSVAAASQDEETSRSSDDNNTNSNAEVAEMERKKRREQCRRSGGVAEIVVGNELIIRGCDQKTDSRRRRRSSSSSNTNSGVEVERVDHDEAADIGESRALSKEELNERVEAFITMFRQHLVLDARRGRS